MAEHARTSMPTAEILTGLRSSAVEAILAAAQKKQAPAKRLLVIAGEPATELFLLVQGRVRYYKTTKAGDEIVLGILVDGDAFGLGTLLASPPPYIANAETSSECDFLTWKHATIRELAAKYPELAENALRIVLRHLKQYAERHARLLSETAEQRVASTLIALSERIGRTRPDGVELNVTNQQLSSLADVSPFTASRLLNGFVRAGAVSKQRAKVVIHMPEALMAE
jgi:CRP-like cAMP-binding protein